MARPTDRRRTRAVRKAMEMVPVSRRELARRAGLSHTTLNRVASGERPASPANERAVFNALRDVRESCNQAMDLLLRAPSPTTRGTTPETGGGASSHGRDRHRTTR